VAKKEKDVKLRVLIHKRKWYHAISDFFRLMHRQKIKGKEWFFGLNLILNENADPGLVLRTTCYEIFPIQMTKYHTSYECKKCHLYIKKTDECKLLGCKTNINEIEEDAPPWCPVNNCDKELLAQILSTDKKQKEDLH